MSVVPIIYVCEKSTARFYPVVYFEDDAVAVRLLVGSGAWIINHDNLKQSLTEDGPQWYVKIPSLEEFVLFKRRVGNRTEWYREGLKPYSDPTIYFEYTKECGEHDVYFS
jgi:hypothetical protein